MFVFFTITICMPHTVCNKKRILKITNSYLFHVSLCSLQKCKHKACTGIVETMSNLISNNNLFTGKTRQISIGQT